MRMNVCDIGGLAEVAAVAGVSRQAASNWRRRYTDFPKPVKILKMSPIWNLREVKMWCKDHGKN